jgi:hypothetical protein
MTYWQAPDRDRGSIGCAVVMPAGSIAEFAMENASVPAVPAEKQLQPGVEGLPPVGNLVAITQVDIGKPLVYHLGAGWTRSGDFPDESAWTAYIRECAGRLEAPLRVEMAP